MIKLIGVRGKSFVSKIVKWFQWGYPYTHVAYVLDDRDKSNPLIIEAWYDVHACHYDIYHKGDPFEYFYIDSTDKQRRMVERFLFQQLGKTYDWLGVIGFAFHKDIEDRQSWFCSELISEALFRAGIDVLESIQSWKITPKLLLISPLVRGDRVV